MTLSAEHQAHIDREFDRNLDAIFLSIYDYVELDGAKPSEIARYLDSTWGYGDAYREWWEASDEGDWR